jgi:hypothetical protein
MVLDYRIATTWLLPYPLQVLVVGMPCHLESQPPSAISFGSLRLSFLFLFPFEVVEMGPEELGSCLSE